MKKSRLLGALSIGLLTVSFNTSAAVVNADWKTVGDDLLTNDDATGLFWLDLTETNNLSRDYVVTQLGSGGDFAGFRYATTAEVVQLWANFNIDLSAGQPTSQAGHDGNVATATAFLGNIVCEYSCSTAPNGAFGITAELVATASYVRIGAAQGYYGNGDPVTTYNIAGGGNSEGSWSSGLYFGHYLVVSEVPIPAAFWLFGSGLFGLIGVARRKVRV